MAGQIKILGEHWEGGGEVMAVRIGDHAPEISDSDSGITIFVLGPDGKHTDEGIAIAIEDVPYIISYLNSVVEYHKKK